MNRKVFSELSRAVGAILRGLNLTETAYEFLGLSKRKGGRGKGEMKKKHEKMLYPTVRVTGCKSGGSGTIIYSEKTPESNVYETYILTNHHVIIDNIRLETKWSTLVKSDIKMDVLSECTVEFFDFEYESWESGHIAYKGEIACYDANMDLALIKVKSEKKFDFVAKLFPKGEHKKRLRMFQKLYCIGCAVGHQPLATEGHLTGFSDVIQNYPYWLSTAPSFYGNSGGAMFLIDTQEFIGIPARIQTTLLGYTKEVITHMSYFIPITSVYRFFDEQLFQFIYDKNFNSDKCREMREEKREQAEIKLAKKAENQVTK